MTALWNIVNPSDPYTLRTDDFEAAAAAILMLGEGHVGLTELDVETPRRLPMFAYGAADNLEPWWIETFGHAPTLDGLEIRMADALDTVVIGRHCDRLDFEAAIAAIDDPGKRKTFAAAWHDRHRTSMNDIGMACRAYAEKLRENYGAQVEATP